MAAVEDRVVSAIHAKFETLPTKCKPRTSVDGRKEWVPLAGIVLIRGDNGSWASSHQDAVIDFLSLVRRECEMRIRRVNPTLQILIFIVES